MEAFRRQTHHLLPAGTPPLSLPSSTVAPFLSLSSANCSHGNREKHCFCWMEKFKTMAQIVGDRHHFLVIVNTFVVTHTLKSSALTFYPWKITIFCSPHRETLVTKEKKILMKDWNLLEHSIKYKPRAKEQMRKHPPWVSLLFVKCVTSRSTTADCILMKPEIMMHFLTAFPMLYSTHHHFQTLNRLDLTSSPHLFQKDLDDIVL